MSLCLYYEREVLEKLLNVNLKKLELRYRTEIDTGITAIEHKFTELVRAVNICFQNESLTPLQRLVLDECFIKIKIA